MDKGMKKRVDQVSELRAACNDYLATVLSLGNECAWTDRKIENIKKLAEEIIEFGK